MTSSNTKKAVFAGGCFWCTEAIFKRIKGVKSVTPGYSGGTNQNPTYQEIHAKNTGEAESISIEFNPAQISYDVLLEVFFKTHDPTTPNQQGYDHGPEYRSAIFYMDEEQKQAAEKAKSMLSKSGYYKSPIITEINKFTGFTPAEDYHHNFFEQNQSSPYCRVIIQPKLEKLQQDFKDKLA
ncbi:peptide-methionine (S)-S-oxide reductase MsrA [Patescibacteria group bacterium]|nr:peptide-methionine (S)-S-oxide reductase MsrA [Patescibacteria group bacterium]